MTDNLFAETEKSRTAAELTILLAAMERLEAIMPRSTLDAVA